MSGAPPTLSMLCLVPPSERAMMESAARLAIDCLTAATGHACRLRLTFDETGAEPSVLILSLRTELATTNPPDMLLSVWGERLARFAACGVGTIIVPTLYRHVEDPRTRPALIERIRQINMVVIRLSHRYGINVADIDRAFSLAGAEAVGSDYRCTGETAVAAGGRVIARTLLGGDPCLPVDAGVLARAREAMDSREWPAGEGEPS